MSDMFILPCRNQASVTAFTKRQIIIRWVIWLLYGAVIMVGFCHHELWSDEAETWLMTREATLQDLINTFSYTGHPPLWFAVLFPFSRTGFPLETMAIINGVISMATAYLVLFRSPFTLVVCLPFLFSLQMMYQFSVVQRGYMLLFLLMFSIVILYPRRHAVPRVYGTLLALAFNSEGFVIIPVLLMTIFFTCETITIPSKPRLIALAIIGMGGLVSLVSLWPLPDMEEKFIGLSHIHYNMFLTQIGNGFLDKNYFYSFWLVDKLSKLLAPWPSFQALINSTYVLALPGIFILSAMFMLLWGTRWTLFLSAWLTWFYFIFTYKYEGRFWHGLLIPIFCMWTLWLYESSKKNVIEHSSPAKIGLKKMLYGVFVVSWLLSDVVGINNYAYDYSNAYSGGPDMAEYIKNAGMQDQLIASLACDRTPAVSLYLPSAHFWMVGENRYSNYIIWNKLLDACKSRMDSILPALQTKAKEFPVLVLSHVKITEVPVGYELKLLHRSPGIMQSFYLYRLATIPHL